MKKVLITGEHSFIGNALDKHLARREGAYQVTKLSLRGEAWRSCNLSSFDSVVHVAGTAAVSRGSAKETDYMAVNRDLALEFARAAKAAGVKHFVFPSSIVVYGSAAPAGETRVVTPETPAAPDNAYGYSKLQAEEGLFAMADETFSVAALRIPTVYGKGCWGGYCALSKGAKLLPVFPACVGKRSVIYVENLAELIRLIIDDGAEGLFYPQDGAYVGADDFIRAIRATRGKGLVTTPAFDPVLKLAGKTAVARRILGGIVYEKGMSEYAKDYRLYDLNEAVRATEGK